MPEPLCLEDFEQDKPWMQPDLPAPVRIDDQIDGVMIQPLSVNRYKPGRLFELLSLRPGPDGTVSQLPIPHVYRVFAEPGSIRAWVYHAVQFDRLTFLEGDYLVVLYDLRPDSPTYGRINEITLGSDFPARLTIPPKVVHGVRNVGPTRTSFVNLPTEFYDPANPDKFRISVDDERMPYVFD